MAVDEDALQCQGDEFRAEAVQGGFDSAALFGPWL